LARREGRKRADPMPKGKKKFHLKKPQEADGATSLVRLENSKEGRECSEGGKKKIKGGTDVFSNSKKVGIETGSAMLARVGGSREKPKGETPTQEREKGTRRLIHTGLLSIIY